MAFRWRADNGPLIVVFVWILSPPPLKEGGGGNVVKFGPSLAKHSGSAHASEDIL